MKKLLKRLTEAGGVSGFEEPVKKIMRKELEDRADEVEEDSLGNLIARKGSGGPKLMLTAHLDQIGMAVKFVDDDGFIRFSKVGGIDDRTLVNQRVKIHTPDRTVKGVISTKPPHLLEEKEKKKAPKKKNLFIDVGASDEEEVKDDIGIEIGNPISFDRDFDTLGKDRVVTAQAFDNRIGCLVLLKVLEEFDGDYTLYAVATAQEEVGLKGARTVAFNVNPDAAVSIDTNIAGDLPGMKPQEAPVKMGEGPVLSLVEAEGKGLITTPKIRNWFKETVEEKDINYQVSVSEGGMTEGAIMYITREGIPAGSIGIPTRNIHSCVEVLNLEDVEKTVEWLSESFKTFKDYFE